MAWSLKPINPLGKIMGVKRDRYGSNMVKMENGKYRFTIAGRRGDMSVEDVHRKLKEQSDNFDETLTSKDRPPMLMATEFKGSGVTKDNNTPYKFTAFYANMGLPSLEIETETYSDDKKIRNSVHKMGWKGNVKSR